MKAKELFPSTIYIGKVTHRFSQIASTNNFAKELIAKGEPVHGTVILTDFQTVGRGQTGKFWHSSSGLNLLSTLILSPNSNRLGFQFYLNKVIALSVANTISEQISEKVSIKWPNDIMVQDQKIAGILIENIYSGSALQHCIIGIGVNINQQIFPTELQHATSIILETGMQHDVLSIAHTLFQQIETNYDVLVNHDATKVIDDYHSLLFRKDEPSLFRKDGQQFIGIIKQVDQQGRLQMMVDGQIHTFRNQEIEYIF